MTISQVLRCPQCTSCAFTLAPASSPGVEPLPEHGELACGRCGARYPIRRFVLDLQPARTSLTLAGLSNRALLAPQLYERLWRPRSLAMLTHGESSTRDELALLAAWVRPQPAQLMLDLGSSTGLYARTLARTAQQRGEPAPAIVALDLAPNMLRAAHGYALRDGIRSIAHVRAPAEQLPFADHSVDLVICGGSLNEFRSMRDALAEVSRVLAADGLFFSTSLGEAHSAAGALAQRGASLGGIRFPSVTAFNVLAEAAGLRITRQQSVGVVTFSLMSRAQSAQGATERPLPVQAAAE